MDGWNEAKEAAGLETDYSRGTRVTAEPDDVALPPALEWSDLSQDQRWHYRNVEYNTQRSLDRRAAHRAFVRAVKRESGGCHRCCERDPACLDFHHRSADRKEMNVSTLISYGHSLDRILAEIEKCAVLCANCHRKEHDEPPDADGVDLEAVREAVTSLDWPGDGSSQH